MKRLMMLVLLLVVVVGACGYNTALSKATVVSSSGINLGWLDVESLPFSVTVRELDTTAPLDCEFVGSLNSGEAPLIFGPDNELRAQRINDGSWHKVVLTSTIDEMEIRPVGQDGHTMQFIYDYNVGPRYCAYFPYEMSVGNSPNVSVSAPDAVTSLAPLTFSTDAVGECAYQTWSESFYFAPSYYLPGGCNEFQRDYGVTYGGLHLNYRVAEYEGGPISEVQTIHVEHIPVSEFEMGLTTSVFTIVGGTIELNATALQAPEAGCDVIEVRGQYTVNDGEEIHFWGTSIDATQPGSYVIVANGYCHSNMNGNWYEVHHDYTVVAYTNVYGAPQPTLAQVAP